MFFLQLQILKLPLRIVSLTRDNNKNLQQVGSLRSHTQNLIF